jgi:phospholipid/cholesterol/gamma-HCH transport system substrate-binding protein
MVGFFVLLSIVLIFVFVIWLIKPTDKEDLTSFRIYFTESVSGLNIDSPVKYRGVTIGKVTKMSINQENIEEIQVDISVYSDTPIKTDTVAKLKAQGITGLNYIDLSQGSKSAPLLCENGEEGMVIKSVPSFLVKVEESFGSVSLNLSSLMESVQLLLREENQEELTRILRHIAAIMAKMDKTMNPQSIADFQQLLSASRGTFEKMEKVVPKIDNLTDRTVIFEERFEKALAAYQVSVAQVGSSMKVFEERNANGDYSVKEGVKEPMKQFSVTMKELESTLEQIKLLLSRYQDSPSDIFLQSEEPDIGPGEK